MLLFLSASTFRSYWFQLIDYLYRSILRGNITLVVREDSVSTSIHRAVDRVGGCSPIIMVYFLWLIAQKAYNDSLARASYQCINVCLLPNYTRLTYPLLLTWRKCLRTVYFVCHFSIKRVYCYLEAYGNIFIYIVIRTECFVTISSFETGEEIN